MAETAQIRQRVRRMIDQAKRTAEVRRARVAAESRDGERALRQVAAPMFKTVAAALKAEGHPFRVSTPADAVRMSTEGSGENFIELVFDTAGEQSELRGRVSRVRGHRLLVEEKIVSRGPAVGSFSDEDALAFLLSELGPFVE